MTEPSARSRSRAHDVSAPPPDTARHATHSRSNHEALEASPDSATTGQGEHRTPFWDDAARMAASPDYQKSLDVIAVGLAATTGIAVSDLAARVADIGARRYADFDQAGWASFAILSLGLEALLPLLDHDCEDLTDDDITTLTDLQVYRTAIKRREREEDSWP
ncbi:hypothetical protein [Actinoplanes sp. NPDC026670]|uniref:hypothetical protein n=1 Tax=Actinoplanes sp. NPDC026670 TaxID=3154700 RepID=UPI0034026D6D